MYASAFINGFVWYWNWQPSHATKFMNKFPFPFSYLHISDCQIYQQQDNEFESVEISQTRMMTVNKYQIMSLISLIELDYFVRHKMIHWWVAVSRSIAFNFCQFFTFEAKPAFIDDYYWLLLIENDNVWYVWSPLITDHRLSLTLQILDVRRSLIDFPFCLICNRSVYNCVHNKQ